MFSPYPTHLSYIFTNIEEGIVPIVDIFKEEQVQNPFAMVIYFRKR